jgi:hypothetical protein
MEKRDERLKAVELELEQACYEAERSFRQYDASDPENRLVTGELERRERSAHEFSYKLFPVVSLQVNPSPAPFLALVRSGTVSRKNLVTD